ncbi:MAG: hypothetical protein FE044_03830 [Thermoplasmata archaeon]|nr:MAG: hypothetical protein FE044_03830 [Thermoplasmata archaeon]
MKKLVAILVVFGMLSSAIAITNANSVINESVKINEPAISFLTAMATPMLLLQCHICILQAIQCFHIKLKALFFQLEALSEA